MHTRTTGQSLRLAIDASHPRSHPEQVTFGLEYNLLNAFTLRGGYAMAADEQDLTFGFGLRLVGFDFDYAYTPAGVFGDVQRYSLRFAL